MSEEETKSINISNGVDMTSIGVAKSIQFAESEDNVADDEVNFNTSKLSDVPTHSAPVYTDIDEKKHHRSLIKVLRGYNASTFAKRGILSEFEFNALNTHSIDELETMLEDVKLAVSMHNSQSFSVDMFKMGIFGIEKAVTSAGIADLTGFTLAMLTTPNMNDYLEELALDMQEYTCVRPSIKIGFIAVQKAMQVSATNEAKKQLKVPEPVSEQAKKLGEDL